MAKNQNTFEKRRRETEKKFRADEKRKKRLARKNDDTRPADGDIHRHPYDGDPTDEVERDSATA